MKSKSLTRRGFIAASATAVAAPYVRTAHAAGSLSIGLWDHWVPGANDVMTKPQTWNDVLSTMIAVRDAHGWTE